MVAEVPMGAGGHTRVFHGDAKKSLDALLPMIE
jgi:hypothetical protein